MPKSSGQKAKLICVLKILQEFTDEEHPISTKEIIQRLTAYDIVAERKSIYDDIATLVSLGYDVVSVPSRLGGGYFLAGRDFEIAEVKFLVDAVAASRFISTKKSRELIQKLEATNSHNLAGKMNRQVVVAGRAKTENERIYYSIDAIHKAIQEDQQISFIYLDWTLQKELAPREEAPRRISPWALIFKEENYYLLGYDDISGMMKHYRVDKMSHVISVAEKRLGRELFEEIDLAKYADQTFGMFGGEEQALTIRFPKRYIGVVMDRFGKNTTIVPEEGDYFRLHEKIVVSSQFYGWLCGLGPEVKIISPETAAVSYRNWLLKILEQ